MKNRWKPKPLEEIQERINDLLNNPKFTEKINKYGAEWEKNYKNKPISSSDFATKYGISFKWIPAIKQLFGLQIVSPLKQKGGETMTEERKDTEQQIDDITKKLEQKIEESMKNILLEIQKKGKEDTTQPSVKTEEKVITTDEDTLVNAFVKAQQKLIELRKKQREEELKKQEEINKIKQEGKKELIQQLIDKCRLDPNAPECRGINFNNEEQVLEKISQLVEKGRQSPIPVITPKLRGQVLREAILGNPKRVSEIIDELYEKYPEIIKQLFSYCAGGKCSVELTNILQKKAEEQKKSEEKQETKKRLFRS
jgi:hypothetical protein